MTREPGATITHTVAAADHDIRLDRWFKRHYSTLPHAMLEKYLRKGQVRLDGKKVKSSAHVQQGQAISCPDIKQHQASVPVKAAIPAREAEQAQAWVLYKDADILVINKPYGLAVQGGSKIDRSLDDMLDALCFDQPSRPKLVHRLDRDTSGVLVLARNSKTAARLVKAFAGKEIDKTYLALVHGSPLPRMGYVDLPLLKEIQGKRSYEKVAVDEEGGKHARTEYRVLQSLARTFALLELKPLTGRTHQLRVHMQAIGHPIVGDRKYGGREFEADGLDIHHTLHLHARRIIIPASIAGRVVDVTAPLPKHMQESFALLGVE